MYCKVAVNPYQHPEGMLRQDFKFIFDPGASATVISKRVYDSLPDEAKPPLVDAYHNIITAQGSSITFYGECECLLELHGKQYQHTALVCDVTEDGFIGCDFLWGSGRSANITVDPKRPSRQSWTIGGNHVVPLHKYRPENETLDLITVNRICLKPGTQYLVPVQATYPLPKGKYVISARDTTDGDEIISNLQIANAVVNGDNKIMVTKVVNVSEEPIILEKGEKIAKAEYGAKFTFSREIQDKSTSASEASDKVDPKQRRKRRRLTHNMRIRQLVLDPDPHRERVPPHLRDLYDRSARILTLEQKKTLAEILCDKQQYFAKDSHDYGYTEMVTHDIETGDQAPIRQRLRHPALALQAEEERLVNEMMEDGQIEPSHSPWSSPVVLAKKKDGSTRFCIDYRKLNEATVKDAYPLPNITGCMNTLNGAKWFCTMDLKCGYWHVGMTQRAKEKSAFICKQGLFQWRVMPFGLCNAPPTFERLMETVLRGLQWKQCLVYLDDIVVFGATFHECSMRLKTVLDALGQAGLKLKAKKCEFFQQSVKFLGHIISGNGIRTDPAKTKEISEWPRPLEGRRLGKRIIPFITQVKSFLGVCSYYRKFIDNFARVAEPLQRFTRDGADLTWTEAAEKSFLHLKIALSSSPILAYPVLGRTFYVDTDACDFAMGAVLTQKDDAGKEHALSYMSKVFTGSEVNHCIWRKEFAAAYKAVRHFESYIYGQEVIVRTDNSAVTHMMRMTDLSAANARMVTYLNGLGVRVEHRKGKEHLVPDGLSRKPEVIDKHRCTQCIEKCKPGTGECATQTDSVMLCRVSTRAQSTQHLPGWSQDLWNVDTLVKEQQDDPELSLIADMVRCNLRCPRDRISHLSTTVKTLHAQYDLLSLKEGLLYRSIPATGEGPERIQLVLARRKRREAFDRVHGGGYGGHLGGRKTNGKIRERFYWPGMISDVRTWVLQCDHCQASKPLLRKTHARLGIYVVGAPMERAAADIAGPLPKTTKGNRYILVIGDYFTRWVEAIPLKNYRSKTIVSAIMDHYITKFGVPLSLHSDQGRSFVSKLMMEYARALGLNKTRTLVYRPQGDGYIERFNRTMGHMLRACMSQDEEQDWDELVPLLAMTYRASVNETTGFTPNMLMLGREVRLPVDLLIPQVNLEDEIYAAEYVEKLRKNMHIVSDMVRQKTGWQVKRSADTYNMKGSNKDLQVGEQVWLNLPSLDANKSSRKLRRRRTGPHLVIGKHGDLKYLIKRTARDEGHAYHVDQLLAYKGIVVPRWVKVWRSNNLPRDTDKTASVGVQTV